MSAGAANKRRASVPFIFATILLDSLGIGLIIPVLPDVIRRFSADPQFINHTYGYFISVYALMQFFTSPLLGMLADRFGRRPVLLSSLLGAGLDYILMAFAPSLLILFIGRVIAGLTGASQTVASSYIADVSDDTNRAANFGMIGAAWGMGFVIGPMLGGLASTLGGSRAPFLAAAVFNLLNLAFGYFVLPESLPPEKRRAVSLSRFNPLSSIAKLFTPSPILKLLWIGTLMFMAGQVYASLWTLYTQYKFNWTASQVGLSLSLIGVLIAFVQGYLASRVIKRFGERKSMIAGLLILSIGYGAYGFASQGWMIYPILILSALAGIANPAVQSQVAKFVPANEQGELQGTVMSLGSLTAIIGPLFFTGLFSYFTSPTAPFIFAGAGYVAAALTAVIAWGLSCMN